MLNVPTLFGTNEHAVYNQLFAAFIAYVFTEMAISSNGKMNNLVPFLSFVCPSSFLWTTSSRMETRDGSCLIGVHPNIREEYA
jgi:hypothetical protein